MISAFSHALDQLGAPDALRKRIAECHGEPHRHYHTLRHIELMLRQLPTGHRFTREMAAATLFHDIVYDPTRADNEDVSLTMFLAAASDLGTGDPLDTDLVSAMILATKSHRFRAGETPEDEAIDILLKADLSILWHPDPQVYAWYADGVRQEYAFVPDAQFREARTRILTGLRDDLLRSERLTSDEGEGLTRNTNWECTQRLSPD